MRLLIVNPNTSESVTRQIARAADSAAMPGDQFQTVSAPYGVPLIVTDEHARAAVPAVVDAVRAHCGLVDGVIIASFGDTGITAVRSVVSCPVVGIARAAFLTALAVADRFTIVSFSPDVAPSLRHITEHYGLADRLSSIRVIDSAEWTDPGTIQVELFDRLVEVCRQAVNDGEEALVFGGGPLAGLAGRIGMNFPIPVIDGTVAAVHMMRALVPASGANDATPANDGVARPPGR